MTAFYLVLLFVVTCSIVDTFGWRTSLVAAVLVFVSLLVYIYLFAPTPPTPGVGKEIFKCLI